MRRRRSAIATDSFDLLLDTITNTFGGILLLAILLVLLVRDDSSDTQSQTAKPIPVEVQQDLQRQVAQLIEQRAILKQSINAQTLASYGSEEPERKTILDALGELARHIATMRANSASIQAEVNGIHRQIRSLDQAQSEFQVEAERLQKEKSELEKEIEGETAQRSQSLELPKESITTKHPEIVILKDQQLYIVATDYGTYNEAHFEITTADSADVNWFGEIYLKAKQGTGIPINASDLSRGLSILDSRTEYLAISLDPSAFAQFAEVRAWCVNNGVEYSVLPLPSFPVYIVRHTLPRRVQ